MWVSTFEYSVHLHSPGDTFILVFPVLSFFKSVPVPKETLIACTTRATHIQLGPEVVSRSEDSRQICKIEP